MCIYYECVCVCAHAVTTYYKCHPKVILLDTILICIKPVSFFSVYFVIELFYCHKLYFFVQLLFNLHRRCACQQPRPWLLWGSSQRPVRKLKREKIIFLQLIFFINVVIHIFNFFIQKIISSIYKILIWYLFLTVNGSRCLFLIHSSMINLKLSPLTIDHTRMNKK